ncbi:MAG TPA: hypothetical protein VLK65_28525 [Vicinamibacteria bacterium]|nr:hypothetical protein [Vicinamibacteria bacterium]
MKSLFVAGWLVLAGLGLAAAEPVQKTLAELLLRHQNGATDAKVFEVGELEANQFLREQADKSLPQGFENPWIRFEESFAIVGATMDLEVVRGALPDSALLNLLSGKVPVELTARLLGEGGVGRLDVERVSMSGIDLPMSLVDALIGDIETIPFLPGFRLGEPFPLPYGVESVHCSLGLVTVRQSASTK